MFVFDKHIPVILTLPDTLEVTQSIRPMHILSIDLVNAE